MTLKPDSTYTYKLLVAVSLALLVIVLALALAPPIAERSVYLQNQIVGTISISLCVGGILAAILPGKCISKHETHSGLSVPALFSNSAVSAIEGHHPNCGRFLDHTVDFQGKLRCAACLGLTVGSTLAIVFLSLYFFLGVTFLQPSFLFVILGEIGISVGFLQTKFKRWLRLIANLLFVAGGSLILVALDQYVKSLFVDVFLLCALLLWIFTRIALSEYDHLRICNSCGLGCRMERKGN